MANAFIEARPKGRPEGSPIVGYVVEDRADHALKSTITQEDAIAWAKAHAYKPLVARVRTQNDKDKPDHWREA